MTSSPSSTISPLPHHLNQTSCTPSSSANTPPVSPPPSVEDPDIRHAPPWVFTLLVENQMRLKQNREYGRFLRYEPLGMRREEARSRTPVNFRTAYDSFVDAFKNDKTQSSSSLECMMADDRNEEEGYARFCRYARFGMLWKQARLPTPEGFRKAYDEYVDSVESDRPPSSSPELDMDEARKQHRMYIRFNRYKRVGMEYENVSSPTPDHFREAYDEFIDAGAYDEYIDSDRSSSPTPEPVTSEARVERVKKAFLKLQEADAEVVDAYGDVGIPPLAQELAVANVRRLRGENSTQRHLGPKATAKKGQDSVLFRNEKGLSKDKSPSSSSILLSSHLRNTRASSNRRTCRSLPKAQPPLSSASKAKAKAMCSRKRKHSVGSTHGMTTRSKAARLRK